MVYRLLTQAGFSGSALSSALTSGLSLCEPLGLCPRDDNKTSSQSFPVPSGSGPLAGILGSSDEVGGFKYVCFP